MIMKAGAGGAGLWWARLGAERRLWGAEDGG